MMNTNSTVTCPVVLLYSGEVTWPQCRVPLCMGKNNMRALSADKHKINTIYSATLRMDMTVLKQWTHKVLAYVNGKSKESH